MANKIVLTVDRRAFDGALQVSISKADDNEAGHGYRIAGPKYDGNGEQLLRHVLTKRDAENIRSYLRCVKEKADG